MNNSFSHLPFCPIYLSLPESIAFDSAIGCYLIGQRMTTNLNSSGNDNFDKKPHDQGPWESLF